jgi:hypothetical protein
MNRTVNELDPAAFENLRMELRRGVLVLAVLAALKSESTGTRCASPFGRRDRHRRKTLPLLRSSRPGTARERWREEEKEQTFYRLGGGQDSLAARREWRASANLDGML